jgi:recombinational DNA repair protein (RecF pathway)
LPLGHEDNGILSLYWGSMKNLSRGMDAMLLDVRFAWRWGNIWGVAPSLGQCSVCGSPLDASEGVPMASDGFLCRGCRRKGHSKNDLEISFFDSVSAKVFGIIKHACLVSAENFVRLEPEMSEAISRDKSFRSEVGNVASWLFSFLKII